MKLIVNLMQLLIIAVLLYPFYYLWETDRIETVCKRYEVGMSPTEVTKQAERYFLKWQELPKSDDNWHLQIVSRASLSGYACDIHGVGNKMASARVVEGAGSQ